MRGYQLNLNLYRMASLRSDYLVTPVVTKFTVGVSCLWGLSQLAKAQGKPPAGTKENED